jgi:hypothetical protein
MSSTSALFLCPEGGLVDQWLWVEGRMGEEVLLMIETPEPVPEEPGEPDVPVEGPDGEDPPPEQVSG